MELSHCQITAVRDEEYQLAFQLKGTQQPFEVLLRLSSRDAHFGDVLHQEAGECSLCLRSPKEARTICLHFMFHTEDGERMQKLLLAWLSRQPERKGNTAGPIRPAGSNEEQVRQRLLRLNRLVQIAQRRGDEIFFYPPDLGSYVTVTGNGTKRVTEEKEDEPFPEHHMQESDWIGQSEMKAYMKHHQRRLYVRRITELELAIANRCSISKRKWNKLIALLGVMQAMSATLPLFDEPNVRVLYRKMIHRVFHLVLWEANLPVPLREVELDGYGEASLVAVALGKHELTPADAAMVLAQYPYIEQNNQDERLLTMIRFMRDMEQMHADVKRVLKRRTVKWLDETHYRMFQVLKMEIGIDQLKEDKRKQVDQFLFLVIKKFAQGAIRDTDCLEQIKRAIAFSRPDPLAALNELLQEAGLRQSKGSARTLLHAMELEYTRTITATLEENELYYWCDRVDIEEDAYDRILARFVQQWMLPGPLSERFVKLMDELMPASAEKIAWRVTVTPAVRPSVQEEEYLLFNGKQLFRLHGRKEAAE